MPTLFVEPKGRTVMPSTRSRILIADDHTLIGELCKKLLEPKFTVVGIVADGHAMVRAARKLRPDVIVVDIAMPQLNGLDAAEKVAEVNRSVKFVYLTMNTDIQIVAEAFRRGASGYLLKTCASGELVAAIREVMRGGSYVSEMFSRDELRILQHHGATSVNEAERLTERQREVLQLLAEGHMMKEVAVTLNMKIRTVAFHKYRIMGKLGVSRTADLVRYAVKTHIIAP
jgi:DNA-binding NarL/FixJ family response regulator